MFFFAALLLGAVQGLCEFLPVSSSGHLALLSMLLPVSGYVPDPLAFETVLHLGTLAAVIFAFRDRIRGLLREGVSMARGGFGINGVPRRRLLLLLAVASAPLALGALLENAVEYATESPILIGAGLCATSILLFFAYRAPEGNKIPQNASLLSALEVGLLQLAAVFPGVSRSGSALCGGMLCGYEREFALDFAFLLSVPAVAGAALFKLPGLLMCGTGEKTLAFCAVGFFASALSGFAAIKLLRLLARKNRLWIFCLYCALAGAATIIISLIRG